MTKTLWKNIRRSIRNSLGRYIAMVLIILLGVAFLTGLRSTRPIMVATETDYLQDNAMFDLRMLSTIGFDEADVQTVQNLEGVTAAEGSAQQDFLWIPEEETLVLRAHQLTQEINRPVLTAGRMPEKGNECLADHLHFSEEMIGQTIQVAKTNTKDTRDFFAYDTYTITGLCQSPLYLDVLRSTTSLGNGTLYGYVLLPEAGIQTEYYTELFVKCGDDFLPYTEDYDRQIDNLTATVEDRTTLSLQNRFGDWISEGKAELQDARAELAKEQEKAEQELEDARLTLLDAQQTLSEGEAELQDAKAQLQDAKVQLDEAAEQMLPGFSSWEAALQQGQQQHQEGLAALQAAAADGQKALDEGKAQLETLEQTYTDGKRAYDEGVAQFTPMYDQWKANEGAYNAGMAQYDQLLAQWKANESAYHTGMEAYQTGYQQYTQGLTAYETAKAEYDLQYDAYTAEKQRYQQAQRDYLANQSSMTPAEQAAKEAELQSTANRLAAQEAVLNATAQQLAQTKAQLDTTKAQLEQTHAQLSAIGQLKATLDQLDTMTAAKLQLEQTRAQLDKSAQDLQLLRVQLDDGWLTYQQNEAAFVQQTTDAQAALDTAQDGLVQFENGIADYRAGEKALAEGEKTLSDGRADYEQGLLDYEEGVETLHRELQDANAEIQDAEEELRALEAPELYVLSRETNSGYVTFENDSQIVSKLATLFPIFFFLIAALVCSTTMTRMVDDDRTQIGTMRALGYSRGAILVKYLLYAGSAALLGCLLGYFLGGYLFPLVIWTAYGMLYDIPGFSLQYDPVLFVLSVLASLLCSVGVTFIACRHEMRSTPANLIRPKTPEAGKRILLEYITPLWKRLKFSHKVSLRNIFRFKKRMIMMILGIAGCTALVLTGFGIRDSVANIGNYQFDDIQKYDISMNASAPIDDAFLEKVEATLGDQNKAIAVTAMSACDITGSQTTKSAQLVVTDDPTISQVISLQHNDQPVEYPTGNGAVLTEKLASLVGAQVGDTVTLSLSDTEKKTFTVTGVTENYVYNYAYITGAGYGQAFGKPYQPKTLLLQLTNPKEDYTVGAALANLSGVTSVSVTSTMRNSIDTMMQSLNAVVALVLCSAGALAFVVLFNLGNINISERIREIATIKVLGFHRNESGAYVFRENLLLSLMGIVVGLPLGVVLHSFVMDQIQVDMVAFRYTVAPLSFVLTVLLVTLFTVITDLILRRKIDRIHMAEALKSIE